MDLLLALNYDYPPSDHKAMALATLQSLVSQKEHGLSLSVLLLSAHPQREEELKSLCAVAKSGLSYVILEKAAIGELYNYAIKNTRATNIIFSGGG